MQNKLSTEEKKLKQKLRNSANVSELKDYCLINNIYINKIIPIDEYISNNYPFGKYIINIQHEITTGSHYCAVLRWLENDTEEKITRDQLFYFDPYGYKPSETFINNIPPETNFFYNKTVFQKMDENICGFYCATFLSLTQTFNLTIKKIDTAIEEFKNYKFID